MKPINIAASSILSALCIAYGAVLSGGFATLISTTAEVGATTTPIFPGEYNKILEQKMYTVGRDWTIAGGILTAAVMASGAAIRSRRKPHAPQLSL